MIHASFQAMDLAARLVSPTRPRWLHVAAVARKAEIIHGVVAAGSQDILLAAAWLHDVGYAPALVDTKLHSLDGAYYLQRVGCYPRLCALVAHHSGARFEAEERGLSAELAEFPLEDSPVMDALVYADLTTGPRGQDMGYDERIDEILVRYPPDDPVHRAWMRAREELRPHIDRVLARLGQPT